MRPKFVVNKNEIVVMIEQVVHSLKVTIASNEYDYNLFGVPSCVD